MFRKTLRASLATAALGAALATSSARAFPVEGGGYRHAVPHHGHQLRHHRGGGFGGGLATGLAVGIGMALIGEAIRQSQQQQERVDPYRDGPTRERPRTTSRPPQQPAKQPNVPQRIRAPEPDISYGTTAYPKMPPMVQVDDTPRRVYRKKDCTYLEKKVAKLKLEIRRLESRIAGKLTDKSGNVVGDFDTTGWDAAWPKADLADRQEQLRRTEAELDACRRG
jgi:hypothetical protein